MNKSSAYLNRRILVIGAVLIVSVSLLSGCGSKSNTASKSTTPTQVAVVSPSASASQSAATCKADTSSASILPIAYFGNILAQVQKEWRPDANISSVRFEKQLAKNFDALCALKVDSDWQIVFYSVSSKTEISANLDNSRKDSAGIPTMSFTFDKTDNSALTTMTYAQFKSQSGWKFHEYSRPETSASEAKYGSQIFKSWKMTMSEAVQKLIDRIKNEKITGAGFYVYIGKASIASKSPYISIYWENGSKRTTFFVEPVTLKTYDTTF